MRKTDKIPERELKVMMVVWENEPPVQRSVLSRALADEKWCDPTILTLCSRLVAKGYLSVEKKGNKNLFTPLVSKEEYMARESISYAKKTKGVSLPAMVGELVKSRGITKDEIAQLEVMLEEYKKNL